MAEARLRVEGLEAALEQWEERERLKKLRQTLADQKTYQGALLGLNEEPHRSAPAFTLRQTEACLTHRPCTVLSMAMAAPTHHQQALQLTIAMSRPQHGVLRNSVCSHRRAFPATQPALPGAPTAAAGPPGPPTAAAAAAAARGELAQPAHRSPGALGGIGSATQPGRCTPQLRKPCEPGGQYQAVPAMQPAQAPHPVLPQQGQCGRL